MRGKKVRWEVALDLMLTVPLLMTGLMLSPDLYKSLVLAPLCAKTISVLATAALALNRIAAAVKDPVRKGLSYLDAEKLIWPATLLTELRVALLNTAVLDSMAVAGLPAASTTSR
jgi:hypothetical protein